MRRHGAGGGGCPPLVNVCKTEWPCSGEVTPRLEKGG